MHTLILATVISLAPWGTATCSVEQPAQKFEPERQTREFHWEKYAADEWHLYDGQTQVAGYHPSNDEFRRIDRQTGEWSSPEPAPWRVRGTGSGSDRTTPTPPFQNFGVVLERISHEEKHHKNGEPVSKQEAHQAIVRQGRNALEDDSRKAHLTIIGSPDDRHKVMEDLDKHSELSKLKSDFHVQAYDPTDWAVTQTGFVNSGAPTIYCQAPGGQVLFRKDKYQGPDNLAEELRRLRPDYDPKKDKPSLIDLGPRFNLNINPWWIVAALILCWLLTGKSK